eukprot:scaffold967_cov173-Ochromonas_danica.AAC.15
MLLEGSVMMGPIVQRTYPSHPPEKGTMETISLKEQSDTKIRQSRFSLEDSQDSGQQYMDGFSHPEGRWRLINSKLCFYSRPTHGNNQNASETSAAHWAAVPS